ncbi:MAG: hypothetical protein J0652_01085 [Desulfobulbaceae bacterium]|nr:hypothetical protein [Desulfobulbaceae bacterium]
MENLPAVSVAPGMEISTTNQNESFFLSGDSFEHGQRIAKMLASSDLVPAQFKGNIQNCLLAMELANRTGSSPLAVMQNLYVVHSKPSWSSQFIVACLNSCGKFSPLRFEITGTGADMECRAVATDLATGEAITGPVVSMEMSRKEGWYAKTGSKWQTMPELMLRYRSATFFGRLYAPEILMGMQTSEEVQDIQRATREAAARSINDLLNS